MIDFRPSNDFITINVRINQILILPLDRGSRDGLRCTLCYFQLSSTKPHNDDDSTFQERECRAGERRTRQQGQMLRVWLLFPPAHTNLSHAPRRRPGWGGLWVTACPRVCCVHHLLRLSATPASSVIVDRPVWSSLFVHSSSSSLVDADEEAVRGFK